MFEDFEIIHQYTRQQAIDDGTFIDVTEVARDAGFLIPIAMTRTVWENFVRVPPDTEDQDEHGRLWDVLWMLRLAIRRSENVSVLTYQLLVRNDNSPPKLETLKAVCGPNDRNEPCLTIMLPMED